MPHNITCGSEILCEKNHKLSKASENFNSKSAPKYVQCKVKEVTGPLTYRLQAMDGKNMGIWHVKDLKPDSESTEFMEIVVAR